MVLIRTVEAMSELFDDEFRVVIATVLRRARQLRSGGEAGDRARHRRFGLGGTFAGHRAYAEGEDLRLLDWNAFARSRELHVKVLEQEHRRALTILLDASASMGAGTPNRFDGARRLAALLGAVALARLDVLTLVVGAKRLEFAGSHALEPYLAVLVALQAEASSSDEPIRAFMHHGGRGRVVWLSDFADLSETTRGLRLLSPVRRRTLGLLAATMDDRSAALDGLVEIVDPERDDRERVRVDAALREAFADELRLHARRTDAAFREAGVALLRQDVDRAPPRSVSQWTDGAWLEWLL